MSGRRSGSFPAGSGDGEGSAEFAGKLTECFGLGLEDEQNVETEQLRNDETAMVGMLSDRVATLLKAGKSPRSGPSSSPADVPVLPGGGHGSGDAQPIFAQSGVDQKNVLPRNKEEVTKGIGDHAIDVKGTTLRDEEIHEDNDFGNIQEGWHSIRETLSTNRPAGSGEPEGPSSPRKQIGGDIGNICKPAVGASLSNGGGSKVPVKMAKIAGAGREKAKEAASPNNPKSGGVGVAPGSPGSQEKKKKLIPGPGSPHELTDPVQKLPRPSSLLGNKSSRPVSEAARNLNPFELKTTPSPAKSTSSASKSPYTPSPTGQQNRIPFARAQTARSSRPEDSPLAADGLALGLPVNSRRTPDFARLLKSTASSSAKYSVGSPSTPTKPSPSKSLGDNRLRKSTPMMGDAGASGSGASPTPAPATPTVGGSGEPGSASLKEQFAAFSRFGDTASDGKQITLSNADKWMKQAHVVDGKKITTTDTSITFKKLFKTAKKVGFEDFKRYVEDLAKSKGLEGKDILEKLANCGHPGHSSATKAAHAGVVSRLTDTTKYTGSHKERFDASGKGKGIEGRRDVQDNSGYVAAFKAKQESPPANK